MIKSHMKEDIFQKIDAILETTEDDIILLHGCNCYGSMGAGIAKAIRNRWPVNVYGPYRKHCDAYKASPIALLGGVFLTPIFETRLTVANGFTQLGYGRGSTPNALTPSIRRCLEHFETMDLDIAKTQFLSVPIGCGLGGLDWEKDVKVLFENTPIEWQISFQ